MIFDYFNNITFGQPWLLLLFIIIPFLIYWKFNKGKKQVASIGISSTKGLANSRSWKNTVQQFPFIFRMLALSCIIIALARPQTKYDETQTEGEGIDI
ncbi:MAG TPA: BatA domain-containing protein, partial [Hanamia sp.]|nr:BatA domain-containing protein [Hanamia sp.]